MIRGSNRLPEDAEDLLPERSILNLEEYLRMLDALGNESRFKLLYRLYRREGLTRVQLERALDNPNLEEDLDILRNAGLLVERRGPDHDSGTDVTSFKPTPVAGTLFEEGVFAVFSEEWEAEETYSD